MTFKSGRTQDQGIRVCVLEGGTLYVNPERFAKMKSAAEGFPLYPHQSFAPDPNTAAYRALKVAGLLDGEIMSLCGSGVKVVVDYELAR